MSHRVPLSLSDPDPVGQSCCARRIPIDLVSNVRHTALRQEEPDNILVA
jgi:hypothetical protein